jgi:hypothetical protein
MIDVNNTPIQNMSLLDLAMQVTGRRDIKSIDFIENGKIVATESFYVDDLDLLPSVHFSLSDVIETSDTISYPSKDFIERVYVKKFPGFV